MVLTIYIIGAVVSWLGFAAYALHEGWRGEGGGDLLLFLIITVTASVLWLFVALGLGINLVSGLLFRRFGPKPITTGPED